MKKITLMFMVCIAFAWQGFSQTLNQNASWPNVNWTVTGTYSTAAGAVEGDPTVDANFAFDDDDAGNPSDDNIAAESPVIDLTAAFTAGEFWLTVSAEYVYYYLADDELVLQYWDADGASWVNWGPNFDTLGTTTSIFDDFCSGTPQTFTSEPLDIAAFTATQQSGFRYRIAYDDNPAGGDWNYGFCFQSPTITSAIPPSCPNPANLVISDSTPTVTTFTWVQGGTETSWEVGGSNTGDTEPTTIFGIVTDPTSTFGHLPEETKIFYVRSICGGDTSDWISLEFTAPAEPPANDECVNAIVLDVNADDSCTEVTSGTIAAATDSGIDNCGGTEDDDVWYSFVATGESHVVTLQNITGGTTDLYHAVYDGTSGCGTLGVALTCSDPNTSLTSGLTIGNTYYVQVYSWTSTAGQTSDFDICIGTPPPPPANDTLAGAIPIEPSAEGSGCASFNFIDSTGGDGTTDSGLDGTCDGVDTGLDRFYSWTATTDALIWNDGAGNPGIIIRDAATEAEITCEGTFAADDVVLSGWTIGQDLIIQIYDYAAADVDTSFCLELFSLPSSPDCAETPISPADAATGVLIPNNELTLTWTAPSAGIVPTDYEVFLGDTSGALTSVGTVGGTDTFIDLINISYATTYYWQVVPLNGASPATGCVEWSFTTEDAPPAPANDECANAVALTVNADLSCTETTSGTIEFATASGEDEASCFGTEDDDVWFSFVATDESHAISLLNVAGSTTDLYHSVWSGSCGTLTNLSCSDPNSSTVSGLTVGETYLLRVYSWTSTAGQDTTFDVCIGTSPSAPANDECANAEALTVNADLSCGVVTAGTTVSATESAEDATGTSGTPNNDVWFSFVAEGTDHTVSLLNVTAVIGTSTDMGMAVYDATGGCGALVFEATSDPNTLGLSGLTAGTTYYLRVYGWSSSATGTAQTTFDVCVGTPPAPPANDDCANATSVAALPYTFTQDASGATNNAGFIDPTDASCSGNGMNDGVWYTFTATATGTVNIAITNVVGWDPEVAIYSGSCGAFICEGRADSAGASGDENLTDVDVTSGVQYWINVGYWSDFTDSSEGPFQIDISDVTLGIDDLDNQSAFTYYPNPVKNILTLNAQNTIESVAMYNMLGQEVLRATPNTLESDLDMSSLQTGTYFVKVTIANVTETIRVIKE